MGHNQPLLILGLNVESISGPPLTAKINIVGANLPTYLESSGHLGIHCIILTKRYTLLSITRELLKNIFLNLNFSRYGLLVIFFHIWYLLFPQECHYQITLPSNFTIKFACDDFSLQVNRSRHLFTLQPNNYFYWIFLRHIFLTNIWTKFLHDPVVHDLMSWRNSLKTFPI